MKKISEEEYVLLLNLEKLGSSIKKKLKDRELSHLSLCELDQLYDICSESLQRFGFDKSYDLTNDGKLLESLLDKITEIDGIQ